MDVVVETTTGKIWGTTVDAITSFGGNNYAEISR